jgi:HK97 family phage major capsid protein
MKRDDEESPVAKAVKDIGGAFDEFKSTWCKRLEKLEIKLDRPRNYAAAGSGSDVEPSEHVKAFGDWLRRPRDQSTRAALEDFDKKGLSTLVPSDGGYAVPKEISDQVQRRLRDISPIRDIAKVVNASTSDFHMLVSLIPSGASGWVGEGATRTGTNTPKLGDVKPTMGTLYAYPTATEESLQDIFFDVVQWLTDSIIEEFAVQEGAAFIAGSGVNRPTGFLNGVPVTTPDKGVSPARAFGTLQYIPTGNATGFPPDASGTPAGAPGDVLWKTVFTLRAGYRRNANWVMSSATASVVRQWKDGVGRYLWQDSLLVGQPAALCGYPVVIAEDMPGIGANSFPVAFGDFQRGYLIVDRAQLRITMDEITSPGNVRFYCRQRIGGMILDDNAIKLIKVATT